MIRTILSVFALVALCAITASAQPQYPSQVKGCARTMTMDMRNCGGNGQPPPNVKGKSNKPDESAQGFNEEPKGSCNQESLYFYYSCGYGLTKPTPEVPFTLQPAASVNKTTRAPKTVTPTVKK